MYPNLNYKLANGEDKRTADAPIQFDRPCDSCKHRKIKCDNLLPCFQCISRGLQCQYTAQPSKRKRKRSAIANLLLESDLEHQKKFAANTKQEYGGNDPKEDIEEHPIVPVATTTCSMGKQFCSNVIQVMQATAAAFYRLMKPIMPYTTEEYSSEISVLLYHRIFTTKIPDEIISGSSIVNFETQQQLLTHSTIFAIGSKLIHLNVKALHFHNAAMTILHLPAIRNRMLLESETAKQLVLSLIYSIVYLILQKNYEAIAPLWHKASDVFRTNEKNFDQQTIEELTYALIILAPIESSRNNDFWIHKLDSFQTGHNNLELSLFKEVTRILAFLSRLGKLVSHEDARSLCYLWRYATEAEKILARFYGSVQYAFYGSLIFGLKAIAAINMPNNMEDEIDRCTKYVEQFYACIVDPVQQMWLKSQFEYLQLVFNKLQQETELLNTYDLSIAAIESLMDVINAVPIRSVQTNFE